VRAHAVDQRGHGRPVVVQRHDRGRRAERVLLGRVERRRVGRARRGYVLVVVAGRRTALVAAIHHAAGPGAARVLDPGVREVALRALPAAAAAAARTVAGAAAAGAGAGGDRPGGRHAVVAAVIGDGVHQRVLVAAVGAWADVAVIGAA